MRDRRAHDFDWPGLRIATALAARVAWDPWRFCAADYRAAAAADDASLALAGRPAEAAWDPELPVAMAEIGRAVEEEAVVELLVADLLPGQRHRL